MTKSKSLQREVADVMATGAEAPTPTTAAERPSGTRVVTEADLAADREFVASLDAHGAVEADEPEATVTENQTGSHQPVAVAVDARPSAVADAAPVRGGVNALVTRLLADPALSYEAIIAQVVAEFPAANTTARSVASTASVLRRKGTSVPMRRGPKA